MHILYQHVNVFCPPLISPSQCDNPTAVQQRGGGEKESFLPTTERLTSTQRNNAAIWLPAKKANGPFSHFC